MSRAFAGIGKLPAVADGEWFHGDRSHRKTFSDQRDRERGKTDPNALGPGVYWSRDEKMVRAYAYPDGWIYTARMNVEPRRVMTSNTRLTAAAIGRLIDGGDPELLLNWGESPRAARVAAMAGYLREDEPLGAILGIFHDIYGWDDKRFVPALVKQGWACYLDSETGNVVVWDHSIIKVTDEQEYVSEDA